MTRRTMTLAPEEKATIGQTTRAMLLVGAFMTLLGAWFGYKALGVASTLGLKVMWKLWTPALMFLPPAVLLGFGVPTLIAGLRFRNVAERGDVSALTSGLGALAIAYVAQATVMLIVVALGLFGALTPALH
jgi:hypothetical protein